jgi:hypothetical protein
MLSACRRMQEECPVEPAGARVATEAGARRRCEEEQGARSKEELRASAHPAPPMPPLHSPHTSLHIFAHTSLDVCADYSESVEYVL